MNTLAHLAGTLASLWLSLFAFNDLGEPALGVALISVFCLMLVLTVLAFIDDWRILRGGNHDQ